MCNSTLLCTGANACGKVCVFNPPLILNNILQSVYLKQVWPLIAMRATINPGLQIALIQYMVQVNISSGSFIDGISLYPLTCQIGWQVLVVSLCHDPYALGSFVPAQSAMLGVVDKSKLPFPSFHFWFEIFLLSFYPDINTRIHLKSEFRQ